MGTDNLKLLGALFASSTVTPAHSKPVQDLINAAREELLADPELGNAQFKVWIAAGRPTYDKVEDK